MQKKFDKSSIILILLGFAAIYLENQFNFKYGILIGVGLFGITAIIWGLEDIINKETDSSLSAQENSAAATLRGIAAAMSGLVLLLIGTAMFISSVLGLIGWGNFALEYIKTRPGILLIFLGALGSAYSIQLILLDPQNNHGFWKILASIPVRLFGVLVLLIGLGLIFSGIFEVFQPDRFQQIFQGILQYFSPPQYL